MFKNIIPELHINIFLPTTKCTHVVRQVRNFADPEAYNTTISY